MLGLCGSLGKRKMNMTEAEAYSNLIVGLVGDYNMIGKPVKAGAIIVAAAGLGTLLRWLIFERKS